MYQHMKSVFGESVKRYDGVFIPFDPANTDYQAYLAWVAEGNEPEIIKGDPV